MNEQINNQNNDSQSNILKELSDIKSFLAVNTNETSNIKSVVAEIKEDLKTIKNDFINRRELNEVVSSIHSEIAPLRKFIYSIIGILVAAVMGAILKLVIR